MGKNKHILFYCQDSDGWINKTMSFKIADWIETYKDAIEDLKYTLRSPKVIKYVSELIAGEKNSISFVDVEWEDGELVYTFNGPHEFNNYYDGDFDFAFKAEFITNFS
jgi:hypothetical protein